MVDLHGLDNDFDDMQNECFKFYTKGNKAAGTRARGLALQLINALKELRKDISKKKQEAK